jgi:hypothetical protein
MLALSPLDRVVGRRDELAALQRLLAHAPAD